jgi:hypothetical protein
MDSSKKNAHITGGAVPGGELGLVLLRFGTGDIATQY